MDSVDVTMLLQGSRPEDQLGYHSAFEAAVSAGRLEGYTPFPYSGITTQEAWLTMWADVLTHMRGTGSDVLYLQYFHGRGIPDPRPFLQEVSRLPQRPIIVTSAGDPFGPVGNAPPDSLVRAVSRSDVTFTTSMGRLASRLERAGGRRITLMANSACDLRFAPAPPPPPQRDFDVVFIGSKPGGRNFTRHLFWSGRRRLAFVERLARRYGKRFGLFGHGWQGTPCWQGPVSFADQVQVCQRAHTVFGGYPNSRADYYTSNRVFIQALSAVPFIDLRVPKTDRLLANGIEWLQFDSINDAAALIDGVLEGRVDGEGIGVAGADAVRARHLSSHRVRLIIDILEEVVAAKREGRTAVPPQLDFFHSGVDPSAEADALRRW